jgi:hypothetical protein
MGGFTAHLEGLKELDAKLAEPANVNSARAKRAFNTALRAGGKVFQTAVQEEAPVRPDLPSGDALPVGAMKQDIEMRLGKDDDGLPAAIVEPGEYTWRQANWVEYGHRMVVGGYSTESKKHPGLYRGPGHQIFEVPEKSFIRKAYEISREAAAEAFEVTLAAEIEKASKS